ncbi:hypothetical protein [Ruminiclostridium papyrosolvens]|uniref:hypothetical protein n=1 Tax=Ruminiclostridium papyrosolvens TaxID=29362 RepID=UPI00040832D1|nr:hypothetical protein [Ruminiclostridium papyrosolvens]
MRDIADKMKFLAFTFLSLFFSIHVAADSAAQSEIQPSSENNASKAINTNWPFNTYIFAAFEYLWCRSYFEPT